MAEERPTRTDNCPTDGDMHRGRTRSTTALKKQEMERQHEEG